MQAQSYDAEKDDEYPNGNNQKWAHDIMKADCLFRFLKRFVPLMRKDNQDNLPAMKLCCYTKTPVVHKY